MSYRCEGCNEAQPVGSRPNRIAIKHRYVEVGRRVCSQIELEASYCDECARAVEVARAEIEKASGSGLSATIGERRAK